MLLKAKKLKVKFIQNFVYKKSKIDVDIKDLFNKYKSASFNKLKNFSLINLPSITKNYLLSLIHNHVVFYPTPASLSYAWSFGSLAGLSLVIQMMSGLLLSMFYLGDTRYAFISVEFIMRDGNYGWLMRYVHSNGASMFFIVVYAHILRGLYYGSYMAPRQLVWCSGVILLILMMATAFTGYVLPWSQMSFWGATVISSMVTIVPYAGKHIAEWIWGGYTVNNFTLY